MAQPAEAVLLMVQWLTIHHHHLSHQRGQERINVSSSATSADYFQLAELPAANLPPTRFATSCWFPQLRILAPKAAEICLPPSYSIRNFVKQFYKGAISTEQTLNEQKQDCLYKAGFKNRYFSCILWVALQLKFSQKAC